jgi:hypothetical protein
MLPSEGQIQAQAHFHSSAKEQEKVLGEVVVGESRCRGGRKFAE